jgi:hypothetical protein
MRRGGGEWTSDGGVSAGGRDGGMSVEAAGLEEEGRGLGEGADARGWGGRFTGERKKGRPTFYLHFVLFRSIF